MTVPIRPLDLDSVQAFVLVADLASFTRAADVMEPSQAAISLKLKRLEDRLGCRLLERTPRHVRLSPRGESFIAAARDLLLAHERAVADAEAAPRRRLTLGISDHVAGPDMPNLFSRLAAYDPGLVIEVRIGPSRELLSLYDRGELDAAVIRRESDRADGQSLVTEQFGWFAAPSWQHRPGEPIRLANMAAPCGVRAVATGAGRGGDPLGGGVRRRRGDGGGGGRQRRAGSGRVGVAGGADRGGRRYRVVRSAASAPVGDRAA